MQNRYALVIGSTLGTNPYQDKLTDSVRQESIESVSEVLSSLGKGYYFKTLGPQGYIKNPSINSARSKIESVTADSSEDVFLIYYWGHAYPSFENAFLLGLSDISKDHNPTNAKLKKNSLNELITTVNAQGFRKIVVVLDCCYSGSATTCFDDFEGDWKLLASTGKNIQYEGVSSNPFTREIVKLLANEDLRERVATPGDTAITIETICDHISIAVSNHKDLSPNISGSFNNFPMAPVHVKIQSSINQNAPKKSLYYKLFRIGQVIKSLNNHGNGININDIRSELDGDHSFMVTNRVGEPDLISIGTFLEYLKTGERLGLWECDEGGQKWHEIEDRLFDEYGNSYNEFIVTGVLRHFPNNIGISEIRRAVQQIISDNQEPTYFRIQRKIQEDCGAFGSDIKLKFVKVLLSLLGYALVLKKASSDTYFPK